MANRLSAILLVLLLLSCHGMALAKKPMEAVNPWEKTFINVDRFLVEHDKPLRYAGYEMSAIQDSVGIGSHLRINKGGKTLVTLDSWADIKFGLYPLLGGKSKQLVVSAFMGGNPGSTNCWIFEMEPKLRLIYDYREYAWDWTHTLGDEPVFADLDHDGIQELIFYDTTNRMQSGLVDKYSPSPEAILKYHPIRKKYLPANHLFTGYLLWSVHEWEANLKHDLQGKGRDADYLNRMDVVRVMFGYFYANRESEALKIYRKYEWMLDEWVGLDNILENLRERPYYRKLKRTIYNNTWNKTEEKEK